METVAKLSLKHITCHHNIPDEFGVRKINTLGYHPQTDSLVEKFTSTLNNMIADSCDIHDKDWDDYLDFLLFAIK